MRQTIRIPVLMALLAATSASPAVAEDYPYAGDWVELPAGVATLASAHRRELCAGDWFMRIFPDGVVNHVSRSGGRYEATGVWACMIDGDDEVCVDDEQADRLYSYAVGDDLFVSCEYPHATRAGFTEMLSSGMMIYNPCAVFARCDPAPDASEPAPRMDPPGAGFFR